MCWREFGGGLWRFEIVASQVEDIVLFEGSEGKAWRQWTMSLPSSPVTTVPPVHLDVVAVTTNLTSPCCPTLSRLHISSSPCFSRDMQYARHASPSAMHTSLLPCASHAWFHGAWFIVLLCCHQLHVFRDRLWLDDPHQLNALHVALAIYTRSSEQALPPRPASRACAR